MAKAKKSAFKEVAKFVARMALFLLPVLVTRLTDSGNTEVAGVVSTVLVLVDKYIHESDSKRNGIVDF